MPDVYATIAEAEPAVVEALVDILERDLANLTFLEGDARALPLKDGSFDVVVFHTTLCHIPEPELALAEASRVLRTGGLLAVFDGDYATVSCSPGDSGEFFGHIAYASLVARKP